MSKEIRLIKKYPNRRLYDTAISGYITVADVKQMIIDFVEIQVVDAKTGEDLTRQVLLQGLLPRHHLLVLLFQTIGEWIAEPSTRALGLVLSDFLPIMKQLHVLLHKRRKNRL